MENVRWFATSSSDVRAYFTNFNGLESVQMWISKGLREFDGSEPRIHNFGIMNLILYSNSMPENSRFLSEKKGPLSLLQCVYNQKPISNMLWKMKPTFQKPLPTHCRPKTGYLVGEWEWKSGIAWMWKNILLLTHSEKGLKIENNQHSGSLPLFWLHWTLLHSTQTLSADAYIFDTDQR